MVLSNPEKIFSIVLHVVVMLMSFYALEALDYAKIVRPEKRHKVPFLHILLSLGLGYLVTQFLLVLLFRG